MLHSALKVLIYFASGAVAGLAASMFPAGQALATVDDSLRDDAWARVEMTRPQLLEWLGPVESIDYGHFQWLPASALDGGTRLTSPIPANLVARPFQIHLGGESFDPIDRPIITIADQSVASAGADYENWWLVQFVGPSKRAWLQDLLDRNVYPISYLHPFTYIVWSSEADILHLQANRPGHVRAVSEFRNSYKIPASMPASDESAPAHRFMILTANAELDQWEDGIEARLGGPIRTIARINSFLSVIYLVATGIRTPDIASLPGVYAVQAIPDDAGIRGEIQNQVNVGNIDRDGLAFPGYLRWLEGTGFDGRGVTVSVVDKDGFRQDHRDLADNLATCMRVAADTSSCSRTGVSSDHATHVAGAIAGTGATNTADIDGFLRGLGVAPGATLVAQDFMPLLGDDHSGMMPDGMTTILQEATRSGALLVNNSWGPSQTARGYDIPTQQVDIAVRDADPETDELEALLPVWAIANGTGDNPDSICAPGSLGSPDEGKNLLAVGATYLIDDAGQQVPQLMNDLAWVSGHGNACDGRRVPHLVAPGCNTDNPVDDDTGSHSHGGNGRPGFNHLQPGFCGTSMAAPNVTGAASVFVQRHRTLYGSTPSPALIKAALAGAAVDLGGNRNANRSGTTVMGHRPDRFQGFGRLDLDAVVNPANHVLYIDQKYVLTDTGSAWTQHVGIDDATQPVRIMLVWTDAPGHGLGGDTPAWVNDLDLRVTATGTLFRGNNIGTDGWSVANGAPDGINNMEAVYLSPQQHGGADLDISVLASNVAADALNPRNPDLAAPRQDFALVCYNCVSDVGTPVIAADLAVRLVQSNLPADPGQRLQIAAEVENLGAAPIRHAQVLFDLPEGIDHVRVPQASGQSGWDCVGTGRQVRCRHLEASLPAATISAFKLTVRIDPDVPATTLPVTARITARRNTDPVPGNDLAQTLLTVSGNVTPIDAIFSDGFEPR